MPCRLFLAYLTPDFFRRTLLLEEIEYAKKKYFPAFLPDE